MCRWAGVDRYLLSNMSGAVLAYSTLVWPEGNYLAAAALRCCCCWRTRGYVSVCLCLCLCLCVFCV